MEKSQKIKIFFRKRQHPLIMISYAAKYLWLLIIPLTKYLIAVRFDLKSWIESNFLDIFTVSVILGYAFLRWLCVYFDLDEDSITARTGFFGITKTKVYFSEISSCTLSQGYIFRAVRACRVYIDTDAKSLDKADIVLELNLRQALEVYNCIVEYSSNNNKNTPRKSNYIFHAKKSELVAFSLLFSSTLSGVIIIVSLIYEANRIVGRAIEEEFIKKVNYQMEKAFVYYLPNLPKYFITAILIIAGGWLISFLANLLRHWNFNCTSKNDLLLIKSGKGTVRRHILKRDRIVYIDYCQSMLMKLFSICSVSVCCTGYGKRRQEISALVPITTSRQANNSIKLLLPGILKIKTTLNTGRKDIKRFVTMPIVYCLIPPAADRILKYFLPRWSSEIRMLAVICFVPLLWHVLVKLISVYFTGIGYEKGCFKLNYCRFYKYHNVLINKSKISKTVIKQNPFQKISGTCTLKIFSASEDIRKHVLKGLNYKKTLNLLKSADFI